MIQAQVANKFHAEAFHAKVKDFSTNLADVAPDSPIDLKVGDLVTYTNDAGLAWINHKILGFERYQMKKAEEAEIKHLVMLVKLEDDLESCSNKSRNLDIRLASFDLLLQHKIHQDVPVQDLKTMLQKCESSILTS